VALLSCSVLLNRCKYQLFSVMASAGERGTGSGLFSLAISAPTPTKAGIEVAELRRYKQASSPAYHLSGLGYMLRWRTSSERMRVTFAAAR